MLQDLLFGQIRDLVKQATDAETAGQYAKAASLYQRAAVLQGQYAGRLSSPDARKDAQKRADGWEQLAQRLLHNPPRRGSRPSTDREPSTPHDGATATAPEEPGLQGVVDGMVVAGATVKWDDIAGLDEVKREVKMAFALNFVARPLRGGRPIELPPWQRILLYGPPGTGKTMIAAAVAGQLPGATFFDAKWSALASKWFGESERIVQLLYENARARSPSVVFLDEVDSVATSREGSGESGASKKVLSALLTALDGVADKMAPPFVLSFAATNRPWSLDTAFLSRFSKAVYVPLPDAAARKAIIALNLERKGYEVAGGGDELAAKTEGYSGRDLAGLCRQVIVDMVYEQNPTLLEVVDQGVEALKQYQVAVRPIALADVERAMQKVRPTVSPDYVHQYDRWRQQMGF